MVKYLMNRFIATLGLCVTACYLNFFPLAQAQMNLTDVLDLASRNDPAYRQARAAYEAAIEARPQSRALYRPSITLSGDTTQNSQDRQFDNPLISGGSEDFNSRGYTLSLTQPLYHRDLLVQLRQADSTVGKAEVQWEAAQQDLLVRVAESYFNVLAAIDNLNFAKAEKEAIHRQLEQTKQRFDVGLIAITDVHESQASYDQSVAQEIEAQNVLANANEALREITGQYHKDLHTLQEKIPLLEPDPNDIDTWANQAVKQNFEVQAAEYDYEIARDEVKRQRAGHYPQLDLSASHNKSISDGGSFGGSDTTNNAISLELSLPIYQGGLVSSRTRQAAHEYTRARELLTQARRSIVRQTRDSFLGVRAAISRVEALHQARISSASSLEATEAGMEVGTRTTVDVLLARRSLFQAERDLARARYDYILNFLHLKQAVGNLTTADFKKVNGWLE